MNAEIITIGDEILIGQIVDTNSAWMAKQLNFIGVDVVQISSIRDNKDHIFEALNEAKTRAKLILITGGLGPTNDDITRITLASYFNRNLELNQQALDNIRNILNKRGIPVGKHNEMQAWLPQGSEVIQNSRGTAPGMWIEDDGYVFVSMPGVPYEMKSMMEHTVIPNLTKRFMLPAIVHKTITVVNIPESVLSTRLTTFETNLPEHVKLAYLPHLNTVRLRLTGKGKSKKEVEKDVSDLMFTLKELLQEAVGAENDENLPETIGQILKEQHLTIGTAESCTGGYLAHQLTSVPGSSAYFEGSIISYSYDIKENLLGVGKEIMTTKGAVSEEVVLQMARSAQKKLNVDVAIAISGIAGPGGGTEQKPVGTVWMCVVVKNKEITRLFHFHGMRQQIIERTSNMALELTRRMLKGLDLPDSF